MNELEFLAIHGTDYKDDSTRIRAARYVYRHSPRICDMHEMGRAFEFTTDYGPATGEPCTATHVRTALYATRRRLVRYNAPYRLIFLENDRVILAPFRLPHV